PLLQRRTRQSSRTWKVADAVTVVALRSVTCRVTVWSPIAQPPGGGKRSTAGPEPTAEGDPPGGVSVHCSAAPVSSPLSASFPEPRSATESYCEIVSPAGVTIDATGVFGRAAVGASAAGTGAPCWK